MTDNTEELKSIIVDYMAKNCLSQKKFANALGVTQTTVSLWLSGKYGFTRANEARIRELCRPASNPVERFRSAVVDALISSDDLSGDARAIAVRIVQGIKQ